MWQVRSNAARAEGRRCDTRCQRISCKTAHGSSKSILISARPRHSWVCKLFGMYVFGRNDKVLWTTVRPDITLAFCGCKDSVLSTKIRGLARGHDHQDLEAHCAILFVFLYSADDFFFVDSCLKKGAVPEGSSAAAAAFKTNHAVCSQSDPKSQWFIEPKGGIFCLLPITSVPRPVQSRLCRRSRRPAFHQGSRVRQTGGAFCSVRYVGRDTSFIPSIRLTVRAHSASPISRSSSSETWYTWRRRRYR